MTTPHAKYFRHRLFPRVRHQRRIADFLTAEVSDLGSTATAQTVAPKRTTNTKAEALVVMGSQPANGDTLMVGGGYTYIFKTALSEALASQTLTNDGTDVTAADTVTVDGRVYTFKSALTEVKAHGTVTTDNTNAVDGATVVVNGKTYTLQGTLTNVDGHVHIGADADTTLLNLARAINGSGGTAGTDYAAANVAHTTVTASSSVTSHAITLTAKSVGVLGNAYTLTQAGTTHYTLVTFAGGVDAIANEVKRGVSNTATMTALFEAITAGSNGGTDYSTGTTAHATVTATNPTGTTVKVTAKSLGVAGNLIAVSEASTHLSWGAATLTGGVDPVVNEVLRGADAAASLANIIKAINDSGTEGTNYSTGTVQNPKVVASAATNDLLLTGSDVASVVPGNSVKLAKTGTALTLPTLAQLDGPLWTATGHAFVDGEGPALLTNSGGALPTGTKTSQLWVHVVDANTVAFATSLEALRKGNFMQTTSAGSGTQSATRDVTTSGIFGLLKRNKPRTVAAATDVDSLK